MLIGLCGFKQAGKTSVADMLVAHYGFVQFGFADGVRDMAAAIDPFVEVGGLHMRYTDALQVFGYEVAKQHEDIRRLLQRIGTEGGRNIFGPDVWVNTLAQKVLNSHARHVVVADVRFPNEVSYILRNGGRVWRINRDGYSPSAELHESEQHIPSLVAERDLYAPDLTVLRQLVDGVMREYGMENK